MQLATTHAIERTSPKGEAFLGTCTLCGKEGLRLSESLDPCTNDRKLTVDEALVETILGVK